MNINCIVACSKNRAIGRENTIPWHLPADLKYFKKITSGNTIIMGRKTFESIGRPLPNRTNVIISRKTDLIIENCYVFDSLEKALDFANIKGEENVFIIGGGEIYKDSISKCNKLYFTEVDVEIDDATVYFPEISDKDWLLESEEKHLADDLNKYNYSFKIFSRK
jgi:dihydrofolate reductase